MKTAKEIRKYYDIIYVRYYRNAIVPPLDGKCVFFVQSEYPGGLSRFKHYGKGVSG